MLLELLCRRAISWNQAGSMTRLLNCSRVAMGWSTTNSSNTLAETCSRLSINAASYHQLHARTPSATAQMGATNQCGASPLLGHYMNEVALQQPCRGKARGNEYQPSNRKRKSKHGFHKRMRSRGGIEVIWRRLIKGRRLLTH